MGALVSGNLFSLLGVNAALGRTFTVEDEQPGRGQVVILSDAFWRRRFAAAPDVIGKTIELSDKTFTIIGVAPPEFKLRYPNATELWAPLTFGPKERADLDGATFKVIARLKRCWLRSSRRCSSPASTSPTSRWRGPWIEAERSPCAPQWAQAGGD
jgi:MacB-like periplasmic core domain